MLGAARERGLQYVGLSDRLYGIVMALRHAKHPTYGVQFHPESVLTKEGKKILGNFIRRAGKVYA